MYEIEDGKFLKKEFVPKLRNRSELLPVFLHEKNVKVIISGGMGELKSTGGVCTEHTHKGCCEDWFIGTI